MNLFNAFSFNLGSKTQPTIDESIAPGAGAPPQQSHTKRRLSSLTLLWPRKRDKRADSLLPPLSAAPNRKRHSSGSTLARFFGSTSSAVPASANAEDRAGRMSVLEATIPVSRPHLRDHRASGYGYGAMDFVLPGIPPTPPLTATIFGFADEGADYIGDLATTSFRNAIARAAESPSSTRALAGSRVDLLEGLEQSQVQTLPPSPVATDEVDPKHIPDGGVGEGEGEGRYAYRHHSRHTTMPEAEEEDSIAENERIQAALEEVVVSDSSEEASLFEIDDQRHVHPAFRTSMIERGRGMSVDQAVESLRDVSPCSPVPLDPMVGTGLQQLAQAGIDVDDADEVSLDISPVLRSGLACLSKRLADRGKTRKNWAGSHAAAGDSNAGLLGREQSYEGQRHIAECGKPIRRMAKSPAPAPPLTRAGSSTQNLTQALASAPPRSRYSAPALLFPAPDKPLPPTPFCSPLAVKRKDPVAQLEKINDDGVILPPSASGLGDAEGKEVIITPVQSEPQLTQQTEFQTVCERCAEIDAANGLRWNMANKDDSSWDRCSGISLGDKREYSTPDQTSPAAQHIEDMSALGPFELHAEEIVKKDSAAPDEWMDKATLAKLEETVAAAQNKTEMATSGAPSLRHLRTGTKPDVTEIFVSDARSDVRTASLVPLPDDEKDDVVRGRIAVDEHFSSLSGNTSYDMERVTSTVTVDEIEAATPPSHMINSSRPFQHHTPETPTLRLRRTVARDDLLTPSRHVHMSPGPNEMRSTLQDGAGQLDFHNEVASKLQSHINESKVDRAQSHTNNRSKVEKSRPTRSARIRKSAMNSKIAKGAKKVGRGIVGGVVAAGASVVDASAAGWGAGVDGQGRRPSGASFVYGTGFF